MYAIIEVSRFHHDLGSIRRALTPAFQRALNRWNIGYELAVWGLEIFQPENFKSLLKKMVITSPFCFSKKNCLTKCRYLIRLSRKKRIFEKVVSFWRYLTFNYSSFSAGNPIFHFPEKNLVPQFFIWNKENIASGLTQGWRKYFHIERTTETSGRLF